MKKVIFLMMLSILSMSAMAQSKPFKTSFSGQGKKINVIINQSNVEIHGYDGTDVIIEQTGEHRRELPKEAEGLRLYTDGIVDNTGVGVNVETEGNVMKIQIPRNRYSGSISLKIPKNIHLIVSDDHQNWSSNGLKIEDMSGEIEVKTHAAKLFLNDITGPLVVNNTGGKVYVNYSKVNQISPSSISARDLIDITLPSDTKANLKIRSYFGDIFTDLDIVALKKEVAGTKVKDEKSTVSVAASSGQTGVYTYKECEDCPKVFAGTAAISKKTDTFEGTINGGGVSMDLRSGGGNIYLRKRK